MKLYVLRNISGEVISISQSKSYILKYIIYKNMKEFDIDKVTNNKKINILVNSFNDLILEEFHGFILTLEEAFIVKTIINESSNRIESVINDLNILLSSLNLSDKNSNIINKTIKLLSKINKPKKLNILLDIKQFILNIFKNNSIKELFKNNF